MADAEARSNFVEDRVEVDRLWEDIPMDILEEIYSRLIAGERVMFRSTCKSWSSVCASVNKHQVQVPTSNSLCLLLSNNRIFHPIYDRCCHMDFQYMPFLTVYMAKDGWFLGKDPIQNLVFFNPFTEEQVILPYIDWEDSIRSVYFSSPPTSTDWFVIVSVTSLTLSNRIEIHTIKRGDDSWSRWKFAQDTDFMFTDYNPPVVCKGLYYFLGQNAKLLIYDPESQIFSFHESPESVSQVMCCPEQYMLETDGRILAVFALSNGSLVIALEWNISMEKWETVESLGDKMLFVSRPSSFCLSATAMGTSNKIYFPRFVGSHGLFYSLSTKKLHTFEIGGTYESFVGSTFVIRATWWYQTLIQQQHLIDFYQQAVTSRFQTKIQQADAQAKKFEEMHEEVISRPLELHQQLPNPYPWLIICDGVRNLSQAFYSILENECHIHVIPELQNNFILGCNHEGLVLLDNSTHMYSFLNILTMKKVQLPPIDDDYWLIAHCVLSLNKDGSWRVVFFEEGSHLKLLSCHLGDTEFVKQDLDYLYGVVEAATSMGRKLFILEYMSFNLYSADLSNHHLDFIQEVEGDWLSETLARGSDWKSHLVESCGQLLFILITSVEQEVIDISIYRADFNAKEWVRWDGIGDQAIFLDETSTSGYSYPATALGLQCNSIYYVISGSRNMFVYDIHDKSIFMYSPCSTVDFHSYPTWLFISSEKD